MSRSALAKADTPRDVPVQLADLNMAAALLLLAERSAGKRARSAYRSAVKHFERATLQFDAARSTNSLSEIQEDSLQTTLGGLERRIDELERRWSA